MLIAHALQGHTVLVVHEDPFQGEYLARVVAAAGAAVAGPVRTCAAGIALIAGDERPGAMVVSQTAQDQDDGSLIDAARRGGMVALLVHPSHVTLAPDRPGQRCLAVPYAGFQVVYELAELLAAERRSDAQPAASLPVSR